MTEAEIKYQTKLMAVRLREVVDGLPENTAGRVIGGQLIESGKSYQAVCKELAQTKLSSKTKTGKK